MSKTDIRKSNFTPLFDSLVDEYGITTAAVFGRVWRYCQMDNGYCHAEQERIADELGLRRETVNRSLKDLVRDEYLVDTTPNTKGRTRIYKDTGKAGLKRTPEPVSEPVSEVVSEVVSEPVIKSHTKTHKTEKTEKTHNTGGGVSSSSFLENASQEQREAFELVRRFRGEKKALEVASREYPLEAARDFLEWCADRGDRVAKRVRDEQASFPGLEVFDNRESKRPEGFSVIENWLKQSYTPAEIALGEKIRSERAEQKRRATAEGLLMMFLDAAKQAGYTGDITQGMFDEWKSGAFENEEEMPGVLALAGQAVTDSMREYFKSPDGERVIVPVSLSNGICV